MLALPKSTEFNKRIPKKKFYENLNVTQEIRKIFIDQIESIYWKNKLATSTLNVKAGERVTEIEIFEIKLNQKDLDSRVLSLIDREIPYHIVYLLEYEGEYQMWIGYKEQSAASSDRYKISKYYNTGWSALEDIDLHIEGLDMDMIYDSYVRQIAGEKLSYRENRESESKISLRDEIEKESMREKLMKQIAELEKKAMNEIQPRRKWDMAQEIKKLKEQLEGV